MIKKSFIICLFAVILLVSFGVFRYASVKNTDNCTKITVWTLQMNDYSDYFNKIIKEYEALNHDVKINWIDIPFSEGEKRTLAAVLSDNPPDLVNLNPDFSAILSQKGVLEEIQENKLKGFNKEIVDAVKFQGKSYIIPWYSTSAVTVYNRTYINKAGIKPPVHFDEYPNAAKTIKRGLNKYITLIPLTENDTTVKILNKYGLNDYKKVNTEDSVKLFEMFKNMYEEDLIPPETITQTHREALEKYMSGEIVMLQAGANFLNMIKDNAPGVYAQTDVAPQAKGSLGQNDFSLMNFVIPNKSKNKEKALDFCLYLTNDKNQLELAQMTNVLATRDAVLNNQFYNDESDLIAKARSVSAKQLFNLKPVLRQQQNQKEINNLINSAVQKILLNNSDIKTELNALSKSWSDLLQQ